MNEKPGFTEAISAIDLALLDARKQFEAGNKDAAYECMQRAHKHLADAVIALLVGAHKEMEQPNPTDAIERLDMPKLTPDKYVSVYMVQYLIDAPTGWQPWRSEVAKKQLSDIIDQLASLREQVERLEKERAIAVEALNELQAMRKQIIHGGAWSKKIDDLFERWRKVQP